MSREKTDILLDDAVKTAVRFLESSGEFYPFAIAMSGSGEVRHVHLHPDEYVANSDLAIAKLISGLRERIAEEDIAVTAIVADVRLPRDETDAIRVELEGCNFPPVTCVLPYKQNNGSLALGELNATHGKVRVFVR